MGYIRVQICRGMAKQDGSFSLIYPSKRWHVIPDKVGLHSQLDGKILCGSLEILVRVYLFCPIGETLDKNPGHIGPL